VWRQAIRIVETNGVEVKFETVLTPVSSEISVSNGKLLDRKLSILDFSHYAIL